MNCLHFVSLLYWQQWFNIKGFPWFSCELLTFRIFALLTTVIKIAIESPTWLWIAYISYLCFIDNSLSITESNRNQVVNCLHFVSLLYWQQLTMQDVQPYYGCELLTFRIFALLTTVKNSTLVLYILLWIAYISYLCFIDNSFVGCIIYSFAVVNCLHFVSLLYWQQYTN